MIKLRYLNLLISSLISLIDIDSLLNLWDSLHNKLIFERNKSISVMRNKWSLSISNFLILNLNDFSNKNLAFSGFQIHVPLLSLLDFASSLPFNGISKWPQI